MPKLMTETETAVKIGMSVHWLRRKRWEGGGIPYIKMTPGGAVRYSEQVIDEYIESRYRTCCSDASENRD
jgi:predicted DNA-binding transcriptional regulator AlpA